MFGFALLGPFNEEGQPPNEPWQTPSLGYHLIPGDEGFVDIGAPKNVGEGFRWNTRNLYYAFDARFLQYFGADSAAAAAVDKAFAILNGLTNLSAYPSDLASLPLNTTRYNYRAQALGLLDVKSLTLSVMLEELGLAQPSRYTWTLHDRDTTGFVCPNFIYMVVQRNFDPSAPNIYSTYVNGTLYTYIIREFCGITPKPLGRVDAEAFEFPVDPTAATDTAVADFLSAAAPGLFYTGLTRDDVAGLKYLMATNTVNWENVSTNSLLVVTNNSLNFLVTSNFATLAAQSLTNDPATLLTLFSGLIINDFTRGLANVITTNISAYFTNVPYSQPGSLAALVVVTNYTTNVVFTYHYTFGNVITNHAYAQGFVTTTTVSNGIPAYSPPGSLPQSITNTVTSIARFSNGEYFLLPTNAVCGFTVLSNQLVNTVRVTNLITTATTAPGTTNVNGQSFTQTIITYFTNSILAVSIPQCVTNGGGPSLRQGVDKLNFFRHDYDSLLGQYWSPITNSYNLTMVTNNTPFVQTLQRVVRTPDILFTARDAASGPGAVIALSRIERNFPNWNEANFPFPGPGTIDPGVVITFNKVGPNFLNPGPFFVQAGGIALSPEATGIPDFLYGSYDGTTNAPVVYPNWVSLNSLENQLYLQITVSGPLPSGSVGVAYSAELQASGFQPPFTWSLAPQSPGLPQGLNLPVSTGTYTAVIAGTPTAAPGIYDFDIQVQDSGGRTTQRNFTIQIDP